MELIISTILFILLIGILIIFIFKDRTVILQTSPLPHPISPSIYPNTNKKISPEVQHCFNSCKTACFKDMGGPFIDYCKNKCARTCGFH